MKVNNMVDTTADTIPENSTRILLPGFEASGELETEGDRDLFSMNLIAGIEYTIEQRGAEPDGTETEDGTLFDPQMYLYDSSRLKIAEDDDSGEGFNSQLTITPTTSGTYYLEASTFNDAYTGSYTVALTASDDYANNPETLGFLEPNSTQTGSIETAGDRDWFGMDLIAGVTYRIEQRGEETDDGTLFDPRMYLYNSAGLQIGGDDDGGEGLNSQLTFTPTISGTFYLEAGGVSDDDTGSYTVALIVTDDEANSPPNAADDQTFTEQDTPVTVNVLANDSDPDGDVLAIVGIDDGPIPTNGRVITNADNTLTYTPAPGFVGTDRFFYVVEDGHGGSDTATVTITVEAPGPTCETIDAASTGDPHLRTFDGLGYDFQAAGEFILFRTEDGGSEYQVRQEPWRDSDYVAINTALTTQLGDTVVGVYSDAEIPLLVDGNAVTLARGERLSVGTGTVSFDGSAYLITDELGNGVWAQLSPGHGFMNLHPFVCSEYAGTIEGLLGDGDGTHANDFALRDGIVLAQPLKETQLYGAFAESWRISQDESLFVYADGESTETFTDPRFPASMVTLNDLDPVARAEAEVVAVDAGLERGTFIFDTTVLDIVLTGVDAFAEAAAARPDFVTEDESRETVVVELNRSPILGADSATVAVGEMVDIDVLANDSDPEGEALTLLNVTDPAGGQAEIVNGQVRFTPATGFSGETVLSYEVGDTAGNVAEGPITVNVVSDQLEPSDFEQLMLELINRARANPEGEAAHYDIDLNANLPSGTISAEPKQPLAMNPLLIDSARTHSTWLLDNDIFSHTGADGSSASDRMEDAGYQFLLPWTSGENISWKGTTDQLPTDLKPFVLSQHEGLFLSEGHRENILGEAFREVGVGQSTGVFTSSGTDYNTSMITQNYALSGSDLFLVGVVYEDLDGDGFYSPGEGLADVAVSADGQTTKTWGSGGYQLPLSPGTYNVVFSGGELSNPVNRTVTLSGENEKIDVVVEEPASTPNQAPEASDDSASTVAGVAVTIDVLVNDTDPEDDPLTITMATEASNGTVIYESIHNTAPNSILYTPNSNFQGEDSFTYTIADTSGNEDTATVRVTVEAPGPTCETIDAASTGDPHLRTFDGLGYDFQAAGEFILFRTEDGGSEYQVRQEPWRDSNYVAINTALTTQLGDTVVGIYSDAEIPLLVDGNAVTLARGERLSVGTGTVSFDGSAYLITDELGNGVWAQLSPGHGFMNLHPFVCSEYAGTIEGLLGDGDGTHANDFALRDGIVLAQPLKETQLYGAFAESWRISQDESLFVYADGESTETFTDPRFPASMVTLNDLDPVARAEAEVVAVDAGLERGTFIFDTTVLDIVLTGVDAFAEAAAARPDFVDEDAGRETVTVELNRAPILGADSATVAVGETVDIDVLANDSDPEGEALTLLNVTDPAGGQAEIVNGQVRFTPATGFSGETVLSYEIGDTAGNVAEGPITVNVVSDQLEPEPIGDPTAFYTLTDATPDVFFLAAGLDAQLLGDTASKTVNIPMDAAARGLDPATTVNLQGASAEYSLQRNGTTLQVRDAANDSLIASLSASTNETSSLRFSDGSVGLTFEDGNIVIGDAVLDNGELVASSTLTLDGNLTSSGVFTAVNAPDGAPEATTFLTLIDTTPETFTLGAGLVVELLGNSAGKAINIPQGAGAEGVDPNTTLYIEGASSAFTFSRNGTTLEIHDDAGHLTASLKASSTETSTLVFTDGFLELAVADSQLTLGGITFTDGLSVPGTDLTIDASETSEALFVIELDTFGGTMQDPASADAGNGAMTFYDDVTIASNTQISDFGTDDTLVLQGVKAVDIDLSVSDGNTRFEFNDGTGTVSIITLLEVSGTYTGIDEFNANANFGDVILA